MFRYKTRCIITLLVFLLGVAAITVFLFKGEGMPQQNEITPVVQEAREPRLIIPETGWEPAFFSTLNERATGVNLSNLRTVALPDNDFEIRFWFDGLPYGVDGIVLRYSANQWTAIRLRGIAEHTHFRMQQETLPVPKSGWETAWQRLVSAGILTLPDATEVQCDAGGLDGGGFVVEINKNRVYRTYRYGSPELAQCNEARQILQISEIFSDEFGLNNSQN